MTLKGLVIKPYWADMILDGKKTWEIRGSATKHRGPVYIIQSGTGQIYGAARLVDCLPLSSMDIINNREKHKVPCGIGTIEYHKPHAWVFEDAVRFLEPVTYQHPQGAVIWVNLPDDAIDKYPEWV